MKIYILAAATALACVIPAAADDRLAYLNTDRVEADTSLRLSLRIPLGAKYDHLRAETQPRMSLGLNLDQPGADTFSMDRRELAVGLTWSGQAFTRAGTDDLTLAQQVAIFSAEGEADGTTDAEIEAAKGGSNAGLWIAGGAVALGGALVLANEASDSLSDTTVCVTRVVLGGDCEPE